MEFIQQTVQASYGCGGPPSYTGWYPKLFCSPEIAAKFDPTIADVHTQNTDEAGNVVGRVLHVARERPDSSSPRSIHATVPAPMLGSSHRISKKPRTGVDPFSWTPTLSRKRA